MFAYTDENDRIVVNRDLIVISVPFALFVLEGFLQWRGYLIFGDVEKWSVALFD